MNLLRWLFGRNRKPVPEAERARELSERIGQAADQITSQLKQYQRARDPFAAMMADMYNRDQLSRLHRGNQQ